MSDNTDVVKELKKMNAFLEAIDWKLWNLHKKYFEDMKKLDANTTEQTPTVVSIPGITTSTSTPTEEVAEKVEPVAPPTVPKYPSIEKWT